MFGQEGNSSKSKRALPVRSQTYQTKEAIESRTLGNGSRDSCQKGGEYGRRTGNIAPQYSMHASGHHHGHNAPMTPPMNTNISQTPQHPLHVHANSYPIPRAMQHSGVQQGIHSQTSHMFNHNIPPQHAQQMETDIISQRQNPASDRHSHPHSNQMQHTTSYSGNNQPMANQWEQKTAQAHHRDKHMLMQMRQTFINFCKKLLDNFDTLQNSRERLPDCLRENLCILKGLKESARSTQGADCIQESFSSLEEIMTSAFQKDYMQTNDNLLIDCDLPFEQELVLVVNNLEEKLDSQLSRYDRIPEFQNRK